MLHGQAPGLECVVEAVAGRRCRHDDHRGTRRCGRRAPAPDRSARSWSEVPSRAAALYVDHHQRQFGHHRQSQRLALERQAGARGGRHGEVACEGRADGGADARDFVFGLDGLHPEVFALASSSRITVAGVIGYEPQRAATRPFGCGAQSPCRGDVAADRAVGAFFRAVRALRYRCLRTGAYWLRSCIPPGLPACWLRLWRGSSLRIWFRCI